MGATTDKIKGVANEAMGKAKQGVGEATGSDRLRAKARSRKKGQGPAGAGRCQGARCGQSRGGRTNKKL